MNGGRGSLQVIMCRGRPGLTNIHPSRLGGPGALQPLGNCKCQQGFPHRLMQSMLAPVVPPAMLRLTYSSMLGRGGRMRPHLVEGSIGAPHFHHQLLHVARHDGSG